MAETFWAVAPEIFWAVAPKIFWVWLIGAMLTSPFLAYGLKNDPGFQVDKEIHGTIKIMFVFLVLLAIWPLPVWVMIDEFLLKPLRALSVIADGD